MKIYATSVTAELLKGKYILLDNDVLGIIFKDPEVFSDIAEIASQGWISIDPFTRFEFRRDVFEPKRRNLVEKFISSELFFPILHHHENFASIEENALLLSRIYRHQRVESKFSTVDLLLAGRLMYNQSNSVLITGNKKDFPSCVFDIIGIMNTEEGDGSIKPLSIVSFNQKKFDACFKAYTSMPE
ncbi:MAG TPA: hypothetical protein PK950_03160 [Candidatus Paceibacterota bacterium]|nr:hypothetical protein [Candidatus Paceibacterota bacterium]